MQRMLKLIQAQSPSTRPKTDCNPEDHSSYRIYTGVNYKDCQPIGPGATSGDVTNQCQDYIDGETSNQECSDTVWLAHGIVHQYVEGIEYGNIYVADDCTGEPLGLGIEEISDAGLCEPFSGGFSSFLCVSYSQYHLILRYGPSLPSLG